MPSVEFFISHRSKEITDWIPIYEEVKELGYNIHTEPVECDISIVLNGKFVNPLPLRGKKILFYHTSDWQLHKWKAMFKPILEEYYDDLIDIEGQEIKDVIEEIYQTNS